jgi:hypothetical protein
VRSAAGKAQGRRVVLPNVTADDLYHLADAYLGYDPDPPDGSGEPWDGDGWYTRREQSLDAPAAAAPLPEPDSPMVARARARTALRWLRRYVEGTSTDGWGEQARASFEAVEHALVDPAAAAPQGAGPLPRKVSDEEVAGAVGRLKAAGMIALPDWVRTCMERGWWLDMFPEMHPPAAPSAPQGGPPEGWPDATEMLRGDFDGVVYGVRNGRVCVFVDHDGLVIRGANDVVYGDPPPACHWAPEHVVRHVLDEAAKRKAAASPPHGEPDAVGGVVSCPKCGASDVDNVGDGERALCCACDHEWVPFQPPQGEPAADRLAAAREGGWQDGYRAGQCHEAQGAAHGESEPDWRAVVRSLLDTSESTILRGHGNMADPDVYEAACPFCSAATNAATQEPHEPDCAGERARMLLAAPHGERPNPSEVPNSSPCVPKVGDRVVVTLRGKVGGLGAGSEPVLVDVERSGGSLALWLSPTEVRPTSDEPREVET